MRGCRHNAGAGVVTPTPREGNDTRTSGPERLVGPCGHALDLFGWITATDRPDADPADAEC